MNPSNWTFAGIILAALLFIFRPGCNVTNSGAFTNRDYSPLNPNFDRSGNYPNNRQYGPNGSNGSNGYVNQASHPGELSPSSVIIGAFNIQSFGPTKASRPHVMEKLVDIVRRYDLLAIQEYRNEDQTVIERFVEQINADGSQYGYIVGLREGHTSHKEQYAYLFDMAKFELTSQPYSINDPQGTMHRPPLVASFRCKQAPENHGFTFTLLNVHVDPDIVEQELSALHAFMPAIFEQHAGEDDFLILGDFNTTERGIQNVRLVQNQLPLIRESWATKVRSQRSIDNIVIDGMRTSEYANQSGVLNVMQQYQLNAESALQISDHFPVWAVFSTVEQEDRMVRGDQSFAQSR